MTADALHTAFHERGVELFGADGKLRFRAPPGALDGDLRQTAVERLAELQALLGAPPPLAWDAEAAGATLAQLSARLDRALADEARAPAHRSLIDAVRFVFTTHARKRDPPLFTSMGWLENELAK
jgi:hypothetical protein